MGQGRCALVVELASPRRSGGCNYASQKLLEKSQQAQNLVTFAQLHWPVLLIV